MPVLIYSRFVGYFLQFLSRSDSRHAVCAVASRFFPGRADMYATAMHFAKHSAANALIDGWKTVELCQAYILLSIYSVPAKRWEEDRSWLYTGLAIR